MLPIIQWIQMVLIVNVNRCNSTSPHIAIIRQVKLSESDHGRLPRQLKGETLLEKCNSSTSYSSCTFMAHHKYQYLRLYVWERTPKANLISPFQEATLLELMIMPVAEPIRFFRVRLLFVKPPPILDIHPGTEQYTSSANCCLQLMTLPGQASHNPYPLSERNFHNLK
jgi:hypothetical protein